MAPSRRKGASKAAAAAAARRQWKVGDLVLAKVKGFPAWPATVSEPEKWGYAADAKKVLVYFFGTQQIAFCNPVDVEAFTEEKKESLLIKRHGKGADFVCAVHEIIENYEKLKKHDQVNSGNSTDEQSLTSENNTAETLTKSLPKNEAPTTMQPGRRKTRSVAVQNDSNVKTENAAGAIGKKGLHDNELLSKVVSSDLIVTEMATEPTYSTRGRFESTQFHRSVSRRRPPSIRHSGISPRADPNKLQNFMMPSSNCVNGAGHIAACGLQDGLLRRNKRIRKSPDAAKHDLDSPDLISNGSTEGNDSEILTADSDALSFNEGSTVESDYIIIPPQSATEICQGDIELSQMLDFQSNAVIHKRKRKPNRKRHSNDAAEFAAKSVEKMASDTDAIKTGCKLRSDNERSTERYSREDGDEHLPLVKRARVRMGRTSSTGQEPDTSQDREKRPPEGSNSVLDHVCGSLDMERDGSTDQNSFLVKGDAGNSSAPNKCPSTKPHTWEAKKNQQFTASLDGEAALPPSKRLHRALEAMSAYAARDNGTSSDGQSPIKANTHGCSSSPSDDISKLSVERQPSGEFLVGKAEKNRIKNTSQDGGSEFSSRPESVLAGSRMSPVVISACATGDSPKPKSCKDVLEVAECYGGKHLLGSSLSDRADPVVVLQCPRSPSPDLYEQVACVNSNNCLQGMVMPPKDSCNTGKLELDKTSASSDVEISLLSSYLLSRTTTILHSTRNDTIMLMDGPDEKCDETTKLGQPLRVEDNQDSGMSDDVVKIGPTEKGSSAASSPALKEVMVDDLDEKNLHPSDSVSDDHLGDKAVSVTQSSSSLTDELDSFVHATPQTSACNVSASDNYSVQINGSCSPAIHSQSDVPKATAKWNSKEANGVLASFEAILGTLTRTKESIGRATRVAIDCAKYGDAAKVVEILACNLEHESSLHRRVDLFFLVDSIAQCSKGLKSDAGGIYPSTILAMLPRLLSAAAPPGSSSQENRRQCLKVLRVWQERRILPESIIRHHIRELDSICGSSCSRAFSRRPFRNERPFDDPIREMEGMLVDEYGSNSCIQLAGFRMPPMLQDEDDGTDSDGGSFGAVTPVHNAENPQVGMNPIPPAGKHRHILEEVDGELEMDDVSPYSKVITSATAGTDSLQKLHHPIGNSVALPFAPPLPKDVPPISPPLPTSPPPPPAFPLPSERPDSFSNNLRSKVYSCLQNMEDSIRRSSKPPSIASGIKPTCDSVQYPAPGSDDFHRQMPKEVPTSNSCTALGSPPVSNQLVRAVNTLPPVDGSYNKSFRLRPPHPAPSNQFSYIQADQRVQSQRDIPAPTYTDRFRAQNGENGNFYKDCDRVSLAPPNAGERWRTPPPFPGPRYPDGSGMHDAPSSYAGQVREPALLNHRWAFPPQAMNRREVMPHGPCPGGPMPVASRGHNFWRPR